MLKVILRALSDREDLLLRIAVAFPMIWAGVHQMINPTDWIGFVPPWKVPQIMAASTCIVSAEHDFPVEIHNPRIVREAMACGKCVLISEDICRSWPYCDLQNGREIIKFNPKNSIDFRNKLTFILDQPHLVKNIGENARKFAEKIENFDTYIASNQEIYKKIIKDK